MVDLAHDLSLRYTAILLLFLFLQIHLRMRSVIFLSQKYKALTFLVCFTFEAVVNLRKRVLEEKSVLVLGAVVFDWDLGAGLLRFLFYYNKVFSHRLSIAVCLDAWLR